jgi:hypothetical protein
VLLPLSGANNTPMVAPAAAPSRSAPKSFAAFAIILFFEFVWN